MTTTEVESRIGMAERAFDLARARVDRFELDLLTAVDALDCEGRNFYCERIKRQKQKIEADLASAKRDCFSARFELEAAWASREEQ